MRRHAPSSSQLHETEAKTVTFSCVDESNRSPDAGLPDEIDEWQTYHAQQVKEASARLLSWMKPFSLLMCPMLGCAQVCGNGFSMRYLALSVGPAVIYMCSLQFTDMFVHGTFKDRTRTHTVNLWAGCFVQVCFFTSMLLLAIWLGVNAPSDLLQHRIFLTLACPVAASGPCWCHLPLRLYILTILPVWLSAWLLFHYLQGFQWTLTCVLYPIFSGITTVYMMHLANNDRWRAFQAICAQERERQNLVAVHAALRGMLSTLFDASCICRMDGLLIECTPELQQLFAGAEAIVGSNLCSFASTAVERGRLEEFLDRATNSVHRAAKIQCSLATRHGPSEAVLYAIVLPGGGCNKPAAVDKGLVFESKAFFVGLQAPSAASLDVPPGDGLVTSASYISTTAESMEAYAEIHRRNDGGKVVVWDLSSSCPASDNGSDDLKVSESETSISFVSSSRPPSAPNTPASRRRVKKRSCGVQVELPRQDQSVQTVAPASLPPPLPRTPSKLQIAGHRPSRKPTEMTTQSSSSSAERSPRSLQSRPSEKSHGSLGSGSISIQSSSIQSSRSSWQSSSLGESSVPSQVSSAPSEMEEVLIGGVDSTDSTWTLDSAKGWRRTSNMRRVSLQEYLMLPRDDQGVRLSFGSLGHELADEKCKVCVHSRKIHGICRYGALCFYCHGKHEIVRAPRRVYRTPMADE